MTVMGVYPSFKPRGASTFIVSQQQPWEISRIGPHLGQHKEEEEGSRAKRGRGVGSQGV